MVIIVFRKGVMMNCSSSCGKAKCLHVSVRLMRTMQEPIVHGLLTKHLLRGVAQKAD